MTNHESKPTHFAIQMDCCADYRDVIDQIKSTIDAQEDEHLEHAYVRLVTESGPGGGWPVVELLGTERSLVLILGEVWGCELEDAIDIVEHGDPR